MLKNLIIGALATIIYHSHIVDATPIGKRIFATVCAFAAVFAMLDLLDSYISEKRYNNVHMLSQKSFSNYRQWFEGMINKKAFGKSEECKKKMILNVILHQKNHAFSGEQIRELLDLATTEQKEKSA